MNNKNSISFVIPIYKSEKTIGKVVDDINDLKNVDWEIILVNDNSPDGVDKIIRNLIRKYPKKITYLKFRKNNGQHLAIIEGLKYTTKKYIATIDDDGQNPPVEILKLMKSINDNDYDVVYGVLKEKKHSFFRNIVSSINRFISVITINNKNKIPISNVRLIKSVITKSMAKTHSNYNYIEGLIFSLTDHIGYVYIDHKERASGKSSYSFVKLFKLWSNHIIGYSNVFIKTISFLSLFVAIFAFIIGLIYLLLTINNSGRPSGWLSTYLTMTFLFSIMFLVLSMLTEYIGRIYIKINQNSKRIVNKIYIHD
ncbi:MAG TPA: glycosyltransferase [Candidatus Woesebacteria bacterium]|nr:glycosyltransferase [Candidatus Woesebacteria bacterium]